MERIRASGDPIVACFCSRTGGDSSSGIRIGNASLGTWIGRRWEGRGEVGMWGCGEDVVRLKGMVMVAVVVAIAIDYNRSRWAHQSW